MKTSVMYVSSWTVDFYDPHILTFPLDFYQIFVNEIRVLYCPMLRVSHCTYYFSELGYLKKLYVLNVLALILTAKKI